MRKVLVPAGAAIILDTLSNNGFEAYVVGGCVRDSLLGITPKDWDICTSATPQEVEQCFSGRRIIETGIQHGTVTVVVGGVGFEVTTFRTDGTYSDNRRPDSVAFVKEIEADLARRDFTMNAMAYNDTVGLVDPFGGEKSLREKLISCVGNADDRFNEDALRIMRALRFASTFGFSIDEQIGTAIHKNASLLNNIAVERINAELCKMLLGKGILRVLLDYDDVITTIIPEMQECIGFEQNNKYHQYTIYEHIAHAVSNYQGDDVCTLVALLLHDIGKPLCYSEDENGGHFHGHGIPSFSIAQNVLERMKFDSKSQHDIAELVLYHDSTIEPTPRTVRRWLNKIGEEQFRRLMDIRLADIQAHAEGTQESRIKRRNDALALANEIIASRQCFSMKDMAINGNDVMSDGIPEGRMVGSALNAALDAVIAGAVENQKDILLDAVHDYFGFVRKRIDTQDVEPFCPFGCAYCDVAYTEHCYWCEEPRKEWLNEQTGTQEP